MSIPSVNKFNKSDESPQSASSSCCNNIEIPPPKNDGNCQQQHQTQRPSLTQIQEHQHQKQQQQFNNKFALFPPHPSFRHRQKKFLFSLPSLFLITFPLTILLRLNGIVVAGGKANAEIVAIRTLGDGPLRQWRPDRMIKCIFCMNYDDYNNLSTFGCELSRVHTCRGNFCYMRQHKRQEYFLYTSGCLNLTANELIGLKANVALATEVANVVPGGAAAEDSPSANWGNETQLCEVGQSVNTCICTNRHLCNNVTAVEPYIEYSDAIFDGMEFDELAHFRFLLPDDPILYEFERERSSASGGGSYGGGNGGYLLVKDAAPAAPRMPSSLLLLLLLMLMDFALCSCCWPT